MATLTSIINNIIQKVNNLTSSKVNKVTSTDNAVVRFNGTTGEVQNSGVIIDNNNNVNMNNSVYGIGGSNKGYIGDANWLFAGSVNDFGIRATNNLTFGIGSIEKMRIDAAGNVGIGVTPSASSIPTLQSQYSMLAGNDESNINTNAYYSGGVFKYIANGYATSYIQQKSGGSHTWRIAPSGTAGNTITWTNAMTLGANGNLLIGTTTDNGIDKLQVNGSISSGTIYRIYNGDLNDYKTKTQVLGTYPSGYVSNIPINDFGYLEVIVYSPNDYVMQRFTTLGAIGASGRIFVRCFVGGTTWSAWVEK